MVLLDTVWMDSKISIPVNKIQGINECNDGSVNKCFISTGPEEEGFFSTEPFGIVRGKLFDALGGGI